MSDSLGYDDAAYYFRVVTEIREVLARTDGDPSGWSDSDKLRYIAMAFDHADLEEGVTDQHEIQDDLRRIADSLEPKTDLNPGCGPHHEDNP